MLFNVKLLKQLRATVVGVPSASKPMPKVPKLRNVENKKRTYNIPVPIPVLTQPQQVQFNLPKIRSLSGHEKIELLRDYIKHKHTNETIFVYRIIKHNGFVNRLSYTDFHNTFHLCVNVPENKEFLQELHSDATKLFSMSSAYLNEYLILLAKWKDENGMLNMIEEIRKIDKVSLTAWNNVLQYYIDEKNHKKGLDLYTKIMQLTPKVRPDQNLYIKGITLYGLNQNMDMCLETYLDAEENLNRLIIEKKNITEKERLRWKTELNVELFITFLNCLEKDQIHDAYKQFITNIDLRQSKRAIRIYHILFKYSLNVKEYWNDMRTFGIKPDYLIYSRMMSLETTEERVYEWYRLGNVSFSLSKYNQLSYDTALILRLLDLEKVEKAYDQIIEFHSLGKAVFDICYKKLLEKFQNDDKKKAILEELLNNKNK